MLEASEMTLTVEKKKLWKQRASDEDDYVYKTIAVTRTK